MLIDTHVHLDCLPPGFLPKEEADLARKAGIGHFVLPGVWREGWPAMHRLAQTIPGVLTAPGLHPQAAHQWNEAAAADLFWYLEKGGAVAIGEIGLDRLIPFPSPAVQEDAFRAQLRVAAAAGMPVLVHCRQAIGRLLKILAEEDFRHGGILHAFSGSPETALAAAARGFAIGFAGPLTYPNARRPIEVLRRLPPEAIVLETDAPDLSPHPHRGKSNRPAWLPLIAAGVAEVRGWSLEETARITTENAMRVLKLKTIGTRYTSPGAGR